MFLVCVVWLTLAIFAVPINAECETTRLIIQDNYGVAISPEGLEIELRPLHYKSDEIQRIVLKAEARIPKGDYRFELYRNKEFIAHGTIVPDRFCQSIASIVVFRPLLISDESPGIFEGRVVGCSPSQLRRMIFKIVPIAGRSAHETRPGHLIWTESGPDASGSFALSLLTFGRMLAFATLDGRLLWTKILDTTDRAIYGYPKIEQQIDLREACREVRL